MSLLPKPEPYELDDPFTYFVPPSLNPTLSETPELGYVVVFISQAISAEISPIKPDTLSEVYFISKYHLPLLTV